MTQQGYRCPAMTRQHFQFLADVLAAHQDRAQHVFGDILLGELVQAFADRLTECNPRFDRARFVAACGVQS